MLKPLSFLLVATLAIFSFNSSISFADDTVSQGTFVGENDHVTTGNITVVKDGNGYQVILADNFSLDGAPDPKLAFGHNGVDKNTIFSSLRSNNGKQVYQLPANIDPSKFNEIYIWCEKFDVSLGKANLSM